MGFPPQSPDWAFGVGSRVDLLWGYKCPSAYVARESTAINVRVCVCVCAHVHACLRAKRGLPAIL